MTEPGIRSVAPERDEEGGARTSRLGSCESIERSESEREIGIERNEIVNEARRSKPFNILLNTFNI